MSHPTPAVSICAVLHVGSAPLPRSKRAALQSLGIEIAHLTPADVEAALTDEVLRPEMVERLATASLCLLGEGAKMEIITAVLLLRQSSPGETWLAGVESYDVARGVTLAYPLTSPSRVRMCGPDIFAELRGLAAEETPLLALDTTTVRGPWPTPYIADPTATTSFEGALGESRQPRMATERLRAGRLTAMDVLVGGGDAELREGHAAAAEVLEWLIQHTATADLHHLATPRVAAWWELAARHGGQEWGHRDVGRLVAVALARDGGKWTLGALPANLGDLRATATEEWESALDQARESTMMECVSGEACSHIDPLSIDHVARIWALIPNEDPLAPDVPAAHYRPTITTLRIARRYRPAPDVLREVYARWGGRPYQEKYTRHQLTRFVAESPPAGPADVENWTRLLTGLPEGRFKAGVRKGIVRGWSRIEIPICNAIGIENINVSTLLHRVPCYDTDGILRDDLVNQLDFDPTQGALGESREVHRNNLQR